MAIDTVAKRASALRYSSRGLLVPPDGTISQGDRQTLLRKYSGILATTPVVIAEFGGNLFILTGGLE